MHLQFISPAPTEQVEQMSVEPIATRGPSERFAADHSRLPNACSLTRLLFLAALGNAVDSRHNTGVERFASRFDSQFPFLV
jgi:hypothetical protein